MRRALLVVLVFVGAVAVVAVAGGLPTDVADLATDDDDSDDCTAGGSVVLEYSAPKGVASISLDAPSSSAGLRARVAVFDTDSGDSLTCQTEEVELDASGDYEFTAFDLDPDEGTCGGESPDSYDEADVLIGETVFRVVATEVPFD